MLLLSLCSFLKMAVAIVQEGQKYELKSGSNFHYTVLASGSGAVHYPSYMVCALLFALSLWDSKYSKACVYQSGGTWVGRSLPNGVEFQLEESVSVADRDAFLIISIQPATEPRRS
jgi:hypothetical protein